MLIFSEPEERRDRKILLRYVPQIVCIAVATAAIVLASLAGFQNRQTLTRADAIACHQIELLKTAIRNTITTSTATLGVKGSAGYAYYRAHPDELAKARAQAATELYAFRVRQC